MRWCIESNGRQAPHLRVISWLFGVSPIGSQVVPLTSNLVFMYVGLLIGLGSKAKAFAYKASGPKSRAKAHKQVQ